MASQARLLKIDKLVITPGSGEHPYVRQRNRYGFDLIAAARYERPALRVDASALDSEEDMQIDIRANNIVWLVERQRSGRLVSWCDLLGLTVEADNEPELASVISEAIHVLFVDLFVDGDLPQFLSDHGWTPGRPLPAALPPGGILFQVPFGTQPVLPQAATG